MLHHWSDFMPRIKFLTEIQEEQHLKLSDYSHQI